MHSSNGTLVDSLKIPHCLCGNVDISFAPHKEFRYSVGSIPKASPVLPLFWLNYTQPSPIFEENKGTRDMLAAGKVTSNLKHVDIPLTYLHALHESATIKTLEASSGTVMANFLTKQETGPQHLESTKWVDSSIHQDRLNISKN